MLILKRRWQHFMPVPKDLLWYVRDGFNTAYQLNTLHGFVDGEALALTWVLLPNKTQDRPIRRNVRSAARCVEDNVR